MPVGSGATLAFDSTRSAHGGLSLKCATGATATTAYAQWGTSLGAGQSQVWWRMYLYFTALPTVTDRLWCAFADTGATSQCAGMYINTSGTFQITDELNDTVLTTTTVIPLNQWFRVEGYVIGSATGSAEFKLFSSMDSTVPDETEDVSLNSRGTLGAFQFGATASKASAPTYWLDDIGVSTAGYLGPAVAAPSPFRVPARTARGRPRAGKARLSGQAPPPANPPAAPFAPPVKPVRGHPAARKGRTAGSPGSPAVPPPAPVPSPFALPAAIRRARGAARKARLRNSPGAPAAVPPAAPAPFRLPAALRRGKAAARRSRLALSGGSPAAVAPPPPPPPFPQVPLDLQCDLNLGGTWTGVTGYAYQRDGSQAPVTITRGRPDESSQANPAACRWQLNNRDGRFSPRNPLSPYYGKLGRNTPVRWSVPAQSSYLRLENGSADRAYVSDNANLDITGSIEMRIALRLTDWQGGILACKWDSGGCWFWGLGPSGKLTFGWFDSGANFYEVASTVPVPYASGDFALRVTMDASTGTVAFYTGTAIGGSWAQLGDTASGTGGAATSIGVSHSSALQVGYSFNVTPAQLTGRVYEYRLYNGITGGSGGSGGSLLTEAGGTLLLESGGALAEESGGGGTVAADAVFSSLTAGTTSFTDSAGNAWNLAGGAEVSDRDYRFHGELSSLPPRWDVTGTDHWVPAQAGGPLRRLSQGTANAMSAMKRAISLLSGSSAPVAYWPMEDAAGATQFGAAIGPYPMTFTSPAPQLAADSSFVASAPLPTLNGSILQGQVQPYTATGSWAVRGLLKVSAPSAGAVLLRIVVQPGAACGVVYILVDTGGNLALEGFGPGGTSAFNTGYFAFGATSPLMFSVEAVPASGGGVQYSLITVAPGASSGFIVTATVSNGLPAGNVTAVQPDITGAFSGTVMGHLHVQSAWENLFDLGQPLNAWSGELAAVRYARLAGENGYACRILGSPDYSAAMGPQGQATLDALLKECEAADLGQQFEPRQQLALGYRTLASMCNQAPALSLDYSQSQPGGVNGSADDSGLDPVYDDQLSANDYTVTRGAASGSQGGTWQYQLSDGSAMSISGPPAGIGDYAKTATANVEYDTQLPDVAGWLVHTGTVDDERWPVVPVNLARTAMAPLQADATALEIGDMIEVADLPDVVLYDPVRQLAFGSSEKLGGFHWTMEFNAVPESPYEVIVLDDPVYGRADSDGSYLFAAIGASDTSFQVVTPNAQLVTWTTNAADFPFDVNVGGERMTVTNITGTGVSTQTFFVTRSVNGVVKSHPADADVRLWFAPILALT